MVLNGNECSNALYNANHRELHVSTIMGFCSDLARRLQTVRDDINNFSTDSGNNVSTVLLYFSLALTCLNLALLLVFYCVCLRNRPIPSTQLVLSGARAAATTATSAV